MLETVSVIFEKARFDAIIPTKGSTHSACLDLYAIEYDWVRFGKTTIIRTGLKINIPHGYMGHVVPRSGLAVNCGFEVMAGIIDSDYRGELKVVLTGANEMERHQVQPGDRIAQLLILPNPQVLVVEGKVEEDTDRGAGGFGSTGS